MLYNEERHMDNLPTVRIKKITLDDFKSVGYGEVVFHCGRKHIPEGTESDILGLYGQNGSGKTSMIEALSIVKAALSGRSVPNKYSKCIASGKSHATITVIFDLQYPFDVIREATYQCCIRKENVPEEEANAKLRAKLDALGISVKDSEFFRSEEEKVILFNERLELNWEESAKRTVLIDTSCENNPFSPDTKRREMVGNNKKTILDLEVCKRRQSEKSQSFIFSKDLIDAIKEHSKNAVFPEILVELQMFARGYFYVIDSEFSRIAESSFLLLIPYAGSFIDLKMEGTVVEKIDRFNKKSELVKQLSEVIEQIVPGLALDYKSVGETIDEDGEPSVRAMLVSRRGEVEIPLSYESDGIKKLTSILSLIVGAFSQKSTTVAIDEFDSGIFEYMLGEILQAFEESGKGQFIFTSHNLRPLEVIDKKFIYFTTTNPYNRYVRLKGIGETNNLRDSYFRELVLNEQDECMYNKTKKSKLVSALRRVGNTWYE